MATDTQLLPESLIRLRQRAIDSRISTVVLVQTKGRAHRYAFIESRVSQGVDRRLYTRADSLRSRARWCFCAGRPPLQRRSRMRKYEWLAPLTGVVFVAILIVSFIVGGEPPDVKNPPQEIIDHYVDNKDSIQIGVLLSMIAAASLLFFAGYLRKVLRAAPGEGGMLPAVALAGATVIAAGGAIDGTLSFVLAESADDIQPAAVQALQAIWDNDWPPVALGAAVLLLASGLSIALYGALPRWLGWIAILLGVIGLTPIGFVSFAGGGLWILVVSILLTVRARSAAQPPTPIAPGTVPPAT
jgi:hypothetical protein